MRWEVADATGNVKYNRSSLWTSPSSVLVTGVLLKATRLNHKQNAKCAVHILDERRSVDVRHA